MDIAKRIKERGMKLEDVASRLTNNRGTIGISQPSMSSLINGNPSYSRLKEIADILGITVSELVADDTEEMVVTVPKDVKTIKIKVE
jgi:transcriptional regulator with XRE-family HTH domain